ncbi:oxidoreductase [Bacillus subtilis]|nr:oxidoreductase [Bacillus subtilis]NRG35468.1 oxidoreductase [Bacillus subtilis]
MMLELNLANASIMDTLEEAALSRELIRVRSRQRCLGKTTALFKFARKHNYGVVVHKHMVGSFKAQYPDVRIVPHIRTEGIFSRASYVCDECVPQDVVHKLERSGVLVTGFYLEKDSLMVYEKPRTDSAPNLLTIELTDEQSIPRIIYKGEDITALVAVDFEWRTRDADQIGSTYFRIKHANTNVKKPVVETKELCVGEKACE